MIENKFQRRTFDEIARALPVEIDDAAITVEHGVSYTKSAIKAHDYAAGVMAAWGAVVERLGVARGLPSQTLKLNRRLCGLLLNSGQLSFVNGNMLLDTWPVGPDNGTYRAADGRYVTMIGLHPHLRDGILDYLNAPNTQRGIQAAVERKSAQQLEDEMAQRRLPCSIVRSPEEWLAHPQGGLMAERPLIEVEDRRSEGKRKLGRAKHRPLEGVRVVELAHLVAGPTIGKLLAEQGADVIAVQGLPLQWVLPLWLDVNWGKKNILLDFKSKVGKARLVELIAEADVLVNSNSPGALERIGLGEEALRQINPNLIYAGVSYAPPSTPWGMRKGFEQIGQAVSGMMHMNSKGLEAPTLISVLLNDYLTGYLGAIGTVAALAAREQRGGYWNVGASLMRCGMMAASLVEDVDAEPYEPVALKDLEAFGVDQSTPFGTITRLTSAVEFSHTPASFDLPTSLPGSSPDTTGWDEAHKHPAYKLRHLPSVMVREGLIRNLVPGHGIEDRGDGGGGLSLASHKLFEIVKHAREIEPHEVIAAAHRRGLFHSHES
jgi:crotonobetainyl-CoA:carnitine CoA-transferase CaiB-like acyl-CoA transferase